MKQPILTKNVWGAMIGLWCVETGFATVAFSVVGRTIAKTPGPFPYLAVTQFFLTTIALQAQLLRPVWFGLAAIIAWRASAMNARHCLVSAYLVALLITLGISWFWPPERMFFVQRGAVPAEIWFILGAGIAVSLLWLYLAKKEPIRQRTTRGM